MSNEPEKFVELSTDASEHRTRHVLLAFPDFRRLFLARLISSIGDRYFSIALAWWVISRDAQNERFMLGILMAVNMLPVVLFGPILGTWVDRLDKRLCMVLADGARALLVGTLSVLLLTDALTLPVLLILCFLTGAFSPLFDSAAAVSLVKLTDEAHLPRAVATDSLVIEISGIAGALLGSVLLAITGVAGAFVFNAVSFVVSLVFVLRIRTVLPAEGAGGDYLHELAEGFRYLRGERKLALLLLTFGFVSFFASPLLLIMPLLVKDVLHAGPAWLAGLQLAFGVGSALVVLGFSFRKGFRNVYEIMTASTLAMGVCLMLLALATSAYVLVGAIFVSGMAVAAVNALAISLFQEYVPYDLKGRFFALLNTICFALMPLTFFVNGSLAEIISLPLLIACNALGTLLLAVVIVMLPRLQNQIGLPS